MFKQNNNEPRSISMNDRDWLITKLVGKMRGQTATGLIRDLVRKEAKEFEINIYTVTDAKLSKLCEKYGVKE